MSVAILSPSIAVGRHRRWQAFGSALTLESLAIVGVIAWIAAHPTPAPLVPLAISIEAAPTLEPPPPVPTPPQPLPTPVKVKSAPPSPTPPPPAPAPTPVVAAPSEIPVAPPSLAPIRNTVAPTPPAPPPPPPAGPSGPSAEYIAKVRAAVQAAFVYPPAAKAAEFVGRTRVAFNLMDAKVSGARVLIGSGMGLVDKAALQAVQKANYPTPPGEQKSTELSFEIWVEFRP